VGERGNEEEEEWKRKDEGRSKRREFVCEEIFKVKKKRNFRMYERNGTRQKEIQNKIFSKCEASYVPINSRSQTFPTREL
jgi:hypothetical protein